jgi:hypothetical protein
MLDKDKKITAKPEELVDVLKIITPKEKVEE